jgi:hypothetical protein
MCMDCGALSEKARIVDAQSLVQVSAAMLLRGLTSSNLNTRSRLNNKSATGIICVLRTCASALWVAEYIRWPEFDARHLTHRSPYHNPSLRLSSCFAHSPHPPSAVNWHISLSWYICRCRGSRTIRLGLIRLLEARCSNRTSIGPRKHRVVLLADNAISRALSCLSIAGPLSQ